MKPATRAYTGRFLTIDQRTEVLPNGRRVSVECVNHPGAVLIVPFLSPGRVVLLRQYRPVIKSWLYEFPAGTIEHGEKPLACARREIIEETGLSGRHTAQTGPHIPRAGILNRNNNHVCGGAPDSGRYGLRRR